MPVARFLIGLAGAALTIIASAGCAPAEDAQMAEDKPRQFAPLVRTQAAWTALERIKNAERAADRIETDVAYLADDALAGREAGSAGYDTAAGYVAARLKEIGVTPASANQTWFQPVPLRSARRDIEAAGLSIIDQAGVKTALTSLEDFIIGQSMAEAQFALSAPAVFVGYGVSAPHQNHDDYQGLDVTGKIVIAFNDAPPRFNSEERAFYRTYDYKLKTAAAKGAVGFIALPTKAELKRYPWARRVAGITRKSMTWLHPDGRAEISAPAIKATAFLSPKGASMLFDDTATSFQALQEAIAARAPLKGFALDKTLVLKGASIIEDTTSPNVVGLLPGADPQLKHEVLVLSAHLDHVGVKDQKASPVIPSNANADSQETDYIHNGALDNAMGVAAMLEAAMMFAKSDPPKRSILFLAVTAEEKGLIGSDYFAHYPAIPAGTRIVANVNLDMPLTLYDFNDIIAFGAERSTLGETVREAASDMGLTLIPDPFPEQGIFTRSDHYRFVEQGVPSVFLFLGQGNGGDKVFSNFMAKHYHQPSDQIDLPINYSAAARFAALNYAIARAIADDDKAPSWRAGDFFGERFAPQNSAPSNLAP